MVSTNKKLTMLQQLREFGYHAVDDGNGYIYVKTKKQEHRFRPVQLKRCDEHEVLVIGDDNDGRRHKVHMDHYLHVKTSPA
jgi:hypothetical protein